MKKPGREHFKKTKQDKRIKITGGRGISEGKRNGQLMSARKSENRCILYVTVINSTREYMIEKSHKKDLYWPEIRDDRPYIRQYHNCENYTRNGASEIEVSQELLLLLLVVVVLVLLEVMRE